MNESVGAKLKKIRLEKGLTLEEVQKKTKIHLSVLKAMEEDSFLNLSQIYIKGFLKIYCKFLGVDPKDYIADYKSDYKEPRLAPTISVGEEKSQAFFAGALTKIGSFIANKKVKTSFVIVVVFIFLATGLFNLGKFIAYKRASLARESRMPGVTKQLDKTKKKKTQATQAQKVSEKSTLSGIRLSILARDDCWVTLKTDGRLVFHSLLKRGKSENWQAKEKMELSLSNAAAVELIVNGERIAALGKKGQARKNILITKKGLTSA